MSPLVHSFVDGINCTVFAYGQTGSGKTYTMGSGGPTASLDQLERGIIPRSLANIFCHVREMERKGLERFRLHVSYIEVYKEELRDLLAVEGYADRGGGSQIHIREDENSLTGQTPNQTFPKVRNYDPWSLTGNELLCPYLMYN